MGLHTFIGQYQIPYNIDDVLCISTDGVVDKHQSC